MHHGPVLGQPKRKIATYTYVTLVWGQVLEIMQGLDSGLIKVPTPRTCRCNVWACLGTLPFTSQGLFWWQELEYRLISKVEAKAVYCRTLYMRSSCAFSIVVVHVRGLDNAYRHFSLLTAVGTVILNKISNCTRFLNGHGWLSICEDEHPPVPGSTCNGLSTIPVF